MACARTCVPPPSLELRVFDLVALDSYSIELQEIERDLISPCMELLSSISWERLAAEYDRGQRDEVEEGKEEKPGGRLFH